MSYLTGVHKVLPINPYGGCQEETKAMAKQQGQTTDGKYEDFVHVEHKFSLDVRHLSISVKFMERTSHRARSVRVRYLRPMYIWH